MTNVEQKSGAPAARREPAATRRGRKISQKLSYMSRWLPSYLWQRATRRRPTGPTHLIFALADHFEPAIVPENGAARAPYDEQERRMERWCREYPIRFGEYRDAEGRPFFHTYYYPAEQYDPAHISRLAEHCRSGWGEIEVHLHHGVGAPDSAENTRRQLVQFRDLLAQRHGCLCYRQGSSEPLYSFVHGNFALANSNRGLACGVDSEMQILAETGCYADLTLPTGAFHRAQTSKINSLYECALPLTERAPHRKGRDLERGITPRIWPLMVQGPLMMDFNTHSRRLQVENGALTGRNPASLRRLRLWKQANISVRGVPDWLFIKLHCHSMDSRHEDATLGASMQAFLRDLITGAGERDEVLHFVSAREMVNILLAACDGREGNPGDYRDYRLRRAVDISPEPQAQSSAAVLKG
ncbi:MAG TPA: hypothetical protein VFA67_16820 [Candidatus Sulfotelmatobacter sp.]|nr:hypothetical protein [Candidatus Sulfotelmatobacter sp.]